MHVLLVVCPAHGMVDRVEHAFFSQSLVQADALITLLLPCNALLIVLMRRISETSLSEPRGAHTTKMRPWKYLDGIFP